MLYQGKSAVCIGVTDYVNMSVYTPPPIFSSAVVIREPLGVARTFLDERPKNFKYGIILWATFL
jgi:hypothetical protein